MRQPGIQSGRSWLSKFPFEIAQAIRPDAVLIFTHHLLCRFAESTFHQHSAEGVVHKRDTGGCHCSVPMPQ